MFKVGKTVSDTLHVQRKLHLVSKLKVNRDVELGKKNRVSYVGSTVNSFGDGVGKRETCLTY